ncbi:M1 family aminopeptidase [Chondromyces apiculatus]|uniref:M1 family aminopeptidase n=1 Tax=Chondromyces apiculatus TaxID=51 RepID=UPI0005C6FB22|nr:M1 family aminopeptidase [Chondromyces apiculatus]
MFDVADGAATSCLWVDAAPEDGEGVSFDSALPVHGLTWNGEPVEACIEGDVLSVGGNAVQYREPARVCSSFTVPEHPEGSNVGFTRNKDKQGNWFTYLRGWVEQCHLLGPCNRHPSQLVELQLHVTHDPEDVVLCSGARTTDGSSTFCVVDDVRAPMYSGLFVAANPAWQRTSHALTSGSEVHFYEVPGTGVLSSIDLVRLDGFMSWITGLLGALPYGEELRVATAPMGWLGYEHPANIMLNERLRDFPPEYADMTMHTLMHEIVHQWAGNRTTLRDARDFAWKEAIADYLVYVYEDAHMPPGVAGATLRYWDRLATSTPLYPVPQDEPPVSLELAAAAAYGTGSMTLLLQLEDLLGREVVVDAVQRFLEEPGARGVADLKASLESTSGTHLDRYFEAWVHGVGSPDWPYMRAEIIEGAVGRALRIEQVTRSGKRYPCRVEAAVETDEGTEMVGGVFALDAPEGSIEIPLHVEGNVAAIKIDPRRRLVNLPFPPDEASLQSQDRGPVFLF